MPGRGASTPRAFTAADAVPQVERIILPVHLIANVLSLTDHGIEWLGGEVIHADGEFAVAQEQISALLEHLDADVIDAEEQGCRRGPGPAGRGAAGKRGADGARCLSGSGARTVSPKLAHYGQRMRRVDTGLIYKDILGSGICFGSRRSEVRILSPRYRNRPLRSGPRP